jgi:hypothetical protein
MSLECGGNPDLSGDTALDSPISISQDSSKSPSPLRSAGALQNAPGSEPPDQSYIALERVKESALIAKAT